MHSNYMCFWFLCIFGDWGDWDVEYVESTEFVLLGQPRPAIAWARPFYRSFRPTSTDCHSAINLPLPNSYWIIVGCQWNTLEHLEPNRFPQRRTAELYIWPLWDQSTSEFDKSPKHHRTPKPGFKFITRVDFPRNGFSEWWGNQ